MGVLFIICKKEQRDALLDELADWKDEGASVFLSGITNKANDGFIILEWSKPIPETFLQKLRNDPDILDYVPIGSVNTPQPT